MPEDLNSRLRGAMDLSALTKKDQPVNSDQAPVSLELPALTVEITEANLRIYLEISTRVPLVIDFYSSQDDSVLLSEKLNKLAVEANGAFLLGRIDISAHARVAEAFSVQQAATVIAVLKGQPFPLFNGNVELDQITVVINKLLEVAAGNGVTEKISVNQDAPAVATTPRLPKHHQDAAEALNAGENQKALEMYQQILRESPADQLAAAGRTYCHRGFCARLRRATDKLPERYQGRTTANEGSLAQVLRDRRKNRPNRCSSSRSTYVDALLALLSRLEPDRTQRRNGYFRRVRLPVSAFTVCGNTTHIAYA